MSSGDFNDVDRPAGSRRDFVRGTMAAVVTAGMKFNWVSAGDASPRWKAAVIGHTGRGNYGHGLDVVFNDRPEIEIVAVADPDPVGRAKAQERTGARRGYADYRAMLERERPHLVSVAPRWSDQHHAMVGAALDVGAHVYCEKPFTVTLAEADDLLARAARTERRIAVAHQGRNSPATLLLKRRLDEGLLGELLEIHIHGKQDKRAGGEDMLVLGTHQFDLVRFFAGDALWCTARILQDGREVTLADRRAATEDIGPVTGDEVEAYFALPHGIAVHFTSRRRTAAAVGPWGMEFVGTKGRARLLNDQHTQVYVLHRDSNTNPAVNQEWLPLSSESAGPAAMLGGQNAANRRVVDDWLAAIAEHREATCSGFAAMKSLEMIHAVFTAGLSRTRVALPLKSRAHPLLGA